MEKYGGARLQGGMVVFSNPPINLTISFYLALFGKSCIAGSFSIIYIHSSELLSTVVRNSGIGLCTSCAEVGGNVASYFVFFGILEYDCLPLHVIARTIIIFFHPAEQILGADWPCRTGSLFGLLEPLTAGDPE